MKNSKHIHFIGIGGSGISALAHLCVHYSKKVTGSDTGKGQILDQLRSKGITIFNQHSADHLTDEVDLVIYSEAIDKKSNPEWKRAEELNVRSLSYFEALGQLSRTHKTIAVAGTHGKTTTTGMLATALIEANLEPLVIMGSTMSVFDNKNIHLGQGDIMAVEACEYKKSFLFLQPYGLILLNCEPEHLDFYGNEDNYLKAYRELVHKLPSNGFLIANMDDSNIRLLANDAPCRVIRVDSLSALKSPLNLKVLGEFNQLNARQALKAAVEIGADPQLAQQGIEKFAGTKRRQEQKGLCNGAIVIDDYAHHPTEIKVTLQAIRNHYPEKELICVFQPHQYSRTLHLFDEFQVAFQQAHKVWITDIYEARDSAEDKQRVSGQKLADHISNAHHHVAYSGSLEKTEQILKAQVNFNSVVIIMGAGNITLLADRLVK